MFKEKHIILASAKRLHILFIGLLLAILFPFGTFAADYYTIETIPNVRLTDRYNHVSNPDGIITASDVAAINSHLQALEDSTGIEVAVVAVTSIGDDDARMFATDLFKHWGIGKKADDNGLLIQLVTEPQQRSVVFETGYGLEGVLPDAICYRLQQRYMIPDMKNGDYSSGMLKGVIAVKEYLLASDYERQAMTGGNAGNEEGLPFWLSFLLIMAFPIGLFLIILISTWYKRRPRVCPRCGQKALVFVRQQTVQPATYASEGIAVDVYRCKNCGYTEEKRHTISRLRREAGGPVIIGGGGFGGSRGGGFGGGFGGGSWGGGGSGGGGSISRF